MKMRRVNIFKGLLMALFVLIGHTCLAQLKLTTIGSVDSAMNVDEKPLVMLLSTRWCGYCQMQKAQLRKNKNFIKAANHFYYVEFDAESDKNIHFHGNEYQTKSSGGAKGIHQLAKALNGSERVAFPTWVLLDKNYQVLFRHSGVLLPKQMNELISAIAAMNSEVTKN